MRRVLAGSFAMVVLATMAVVGIGHSAHGDITNAVCDESNGQEINGNVTGNVQVPANGVCHIHGWTINGNMNVAQNAKLFTRSGTVIHGNLRAISPAQVNIEDHTQIDGNFWASGPGTAFGGFICGSTIGGNVLVQNFTVAAPGWVIGQPTSPPPDGYVYSSSDPDLNCTSPNTIHGYVLLTGNHIARLKLAANTIGPATTSNASLNSNAVVNESVKVEANNIAGNLNCASNTWSGGSPAVTDEGLVNTVFGTTNGQCVGLSISP